MKAAKDKRLEGQLGNIRTTLRDKKIPYAGISRDSESIVTRFRDADTREKARVELEKSTGDLAYKTSEAGGEFRRCDPGEDERVRREVGITGRDAPPRFSGEQHGSIHCLPL